MSADSVFVKTEVNLEELEVLAEHIDELVEVV